MKLRGLILILCLYATASLGTEQCYRLEGLRLVSRGLKQCTQQAEPLECGPPKPCPPITFKINCRTKTKTVTGGGQCLTWGDPVCSMVGDTKECSPGPCTSNAPRTCSEVQVSCGDPGPSVPSTGEYSCSTNECSASAPPPPGACEAEELCSGDEHCD